MRAVGELGFKIIAEPGIKTRRHMLRSQGEVFIGVDAGASNIRVTVINLDNLIALHATYPSVMVGLGSSYLMDEMCRSIATAVKNMLSNNGLKPLILGISFAGVINTHIEGIIRKCVADILNIELSKVFVFPDYIAAHAASFMFGDGVIGILGTGSIVYGRYKDKEVRIGGWGHLLGDEGSAYRLGLHAIRNYLLFLEGRTPRTRLHGLVESRFKTRDLGEILGLIYLSKNPKKFIASIAPDVFMAAREGDKIAKEIIEMEMNNFFKQIIYAVKKLNIDRPLISFTGSVYEKNKELLKPVFMRMLEEAFGPNAVLREPTMTPSCASALIAVKEAALNDLIEPLIKTCKESMLSFTADED